MKIENNLHLNLLEFFQKNLDLLNEKSKIRIQNLISKKKDLIFSKITTNSKETTGPETIFCLLNKNNLEYLDEALKNNVICFSEEFKNLEKFQNTENLFFVSNNVGIRKFYAILAQNFFNLEKIFGKFLKINAITGTNGKSSSVFFFKQLMNFLGEKSASIGTIGICSDDSNHFERIGITTPDSFKLQEIISNLADKNIYNIALEASSHGIEQDRLYGLPPFSSVCFTNFSQDHLDYHKTMDEYWRSKKKLFENYVDPEKTICCINLDDPKSAELIELCEKKSLNFIRFSTKNENCEISLKEFEIQDDFSLLVKIKILDKIFSFKLNSIAFFQISNLMTAISCCLSSLREDKWSLNEALEIFEKKMQNSKTIISPPGRSEIFHFKEKNAIIVIDYAHTPEALKTILLDLKKLFAKKNLKILTIFGCGGERDQEKREIMGEISSNYSDFVIITSDNPRNENPDNIADQIILGAKKTNKNNFKKVLSRRGAIEFGIKDLTGEYKILLIAGKGHESEQIFENNRVEKFNDLEVVKEIIKNLK